MLLKFIKRIDKLKFIIIFFTFFFISYFSIHILRDLSYLFSIQSNSIIIIGFIHGLIVCTFLYFFFNYNFGKYLNEIKNSLYIKNNYKLYLIITIIFLMIVTILNLYLNHIESNDLNYLFYEISTKVKFSKPFGFFWNFKNILGGTLFAISVFSFYFFLRFFAINEYISFFIAGIFCTSQTHIYNLVTSPFRDYIKSPVIILLLLLFLKIIFPKEKNENNFKIYTFVTILLLYIGLFLRSDILIYHIIFLGIFAYLFTKNLFLKDYSNNIFYFSLSLYLIINLSHFSTFAFLQSDFMNTAATFISPINENLKIFSPGYDVGNIFRDEYIRNLVTFDNNYEMQSILLFPADFFIKVIASIINILNMPFKNILPPPGLEHNIIENFYYGRFLILNFFEFKILIVFLLSSFFFIHKNKLDGWVMIAIMLGILVYPIIQHAIKHYFYLEILSLWSIAYLIQVIFNFRKK